jgi:hypothetical protein
MHTCMRMRDYITHLLLVDGNPLGLGKPLVVLDVCHPVLQVAEPLRQVHLQTESGDMKINVSARILIARL